MKNLSDEEDEIISLSIKLKIHGLIVVVFILLKLKTGLDLKFMSS